MARILVVEDDHDIAMGLNEDLTRHGHQVQVARDGDTAVRRGSEGWDVILLDVMLPHRDGFEVCRELRRQRVKTPVILLTARSQEAEKILGLEFGADDYVTKPFSHAELRARIKAVMRRFEDLPNSGTLRFGDCDVDFERARVSRGGRSVEMTALELRLLACLVRARGRVLSREQLIQQAWGQDTHIGDRVVDNHILNLRRKIEPDPAEPRFVKSVRGMGYRFDD